MKITLFCRFGCLSRFTHFKEIFWPAVLVRGTPLVFFQLCDDDVDDDDDEVAPDALPGLPLLEDILELGLLGHVGELRQHLGETLLACLAGCFGCLPVCLIVFWLVSLFIYLFVGLHYCLYYCLNFL